MTLQPFLPMMIAVPVSWHTGNTPPAAMLAFFRKSSATNLLVGACFLVVEDRAQLLQMPRPQIVIDLTAKRRFRQRACNASRETDQRLSLPNTFLDGHALGRDLLVGKWCRSPTETAGCAYRAERAFADRERLTGRSAAARRFFFRAGGSFKRRSQAIPLRSKPFCSKGRFQGPRSAQRSLAFSLTRFLALPLHSSPA